MVGLFEQNPHSNALSPAILLTAEDDMTPKLNTGSLFTVYREKFMFHAVVIRTVGKNI